MSREPVELGPFIIDAEGGDVVRIPVPEGFRVVEISHPQVAELKGLVSRMRDLGDCIEYCNEYLQASAHEGPHVVMVALWKSAVMSYWRAFSKDSRGVSSLTLDRLSDLPGDALQAHKYFTRLRNKFVAHSDSGLEDVVVGARISTTGGPEVSLLVTHLAGHLLVDEGAATLSRLAQALLDSHSGRVSRLHAEIADDLKTSSPADLATRPDLEFRMPNAEDLLG